MKINVFNLPLAGFIIVFLLILQFNSFRKTTIVLLSIPLGLIGVILGLLMFQSYFGFMAFMGVISLAGIVINNAIVLLDRIDIELIYLRQDIDEDIDILVAVAGGRTAPADDPAGDKEGEIEIGPQTMAQQDQKRNRGSRQH